MQQPTGNSIPIPIDDTTPIDIWFISLVFKLLNIQPITVPLSWSISNKKQDMWNTMHDNDDNDDDNKP